MRLFIAFLPLILTSNLFATNLKMKPGLWSVQTELSSDGKKEDPMAKVREAMKKLSPEQRKQAEALLAGQSKGPKVQLDKKGISVCYTEEIIKNDLNLKEEQEKQDCKTTNYKKSSRHISMDFKCKDGLEGHSDWELVDDTHTKGKTTIKGPKGNRELIYKAEYLGPCK